MDIDALAQSPVGQLVPLHGQDARHGEFAYLAFLPAPLPPDVGLDSSTWTAVTEAATALGRLDQVCMQLPDPRLLIRPALWREALDTSALEGTYGALQDLLEAQLPSAQFLSPETVEIRAYERVALIAFDLIRSRPISVGFLSELQGELLLHARKQPRDLGRVREHTVWIGNKDRPIQEARFVPAPYGDRLRAGMDAWEQWVQTEHAHLPPILRAALAHYQFETLHPFGDGNGRIGRLVIVLQLLRAGAIQHPAVTVSPWLLRRREEYQQHLFQISCTGDWNPWVRFFCQAVSVQCGSLVSGAESLLTWLSESRRALHERRWTGTIHRLLEDLVEWPVITIGDTANRYDVTPVHAARMVNHLVDVGILKELTGKSYGRVFGATFVIDTVEGI
jgi:Fic family protein